MTEVIFRLEHKVRAVLTGEDVWVVDGSWKTKDESEARSWLKTINPVFRDNYRLVRFTTISEVLND